MHKKILLPFLFLNTLILNSQQEYLSRFLSDSSLVHSSVSLSVIDTDSGIVIAGYNAQKSLSQASVMKLVTTAAAIDLLGPFYTFKTEIGYTGELNKRSGLLKGDIIIKGGGDPSLGSENFAEHYGSVTDNWIGELKKSGIKRIKGRIIADDSRFDHQPVPGGWNWEDIGNYYGAGAYGLSIFDNTIKIHLKTGAEGSGTEITAVDPDLPYLEYANNLTSSGLTDQGYVYMAPYAKKGWINGTIPVSQDDFVLKASIPDPPLAAAYMLREKLSEAGITTKAEPTTSRLLGIDEFPDFKPVTVTTSPPLYLIIENLNHESVNLYAEHLLKELGVVFNGEGSVSAGIEIVRKYLDNMGIEGSGMFIEDGSGLSPQDALSSEALASLLYKMKRNSMNFGWFYNSLPVAGQEGTLKNYFKDPLFAASLRAKSGTLSRVKSYAGYLKTQSGKELAFSIIVNNFTGSSSGLVKKIEALLREIILNE